MLANFRVLPSFFYCYEMENEITDLSNPIEKMKVKEPRQAIPITMGSLLPKRNLVYKYKEKSKKSSLH